MLHFLFVCLVERDTGCTRLHVSSCWVKRWGYWAWDTKVTKEDSNVVIHWVRIKPLKKSRFFIPLCHLRCLPLVWLINKVDVSWLENEFVMDYRDSERAFYKSPYNNLEEILFVFDDIMASRSSSWQEANQEFDAMLQNDSDIVHLAGKMFFVCEGNHHLTAWWRHINKYHSFDKDWHISVNCIVVDPKKCTAVFFNSISDINWWVFFLIFFSCFLLFFHFHWFFRSTEHDHVKDNLLAKMLCIRTFGHWSSKISKTSFSLPTIRCTRLIWTRILLGIPLPWTSLSNSCTRSIPIYFLSIFRCSFDALPLYSSLHFLERNIKCSWYSRGLMVGS